eukprot:CAMPEP_0197574298 /NCGR_PEP_ID=MMETSP1326-20131121/39_1 /TAXON_ID=1155430 /ORGANISM="Genus nov. species nov., Strain RCC2288" /LENGTH=321 /DNA_ID=CAMNT_0043136843 /DNA_START=325 /DNA_END=1290 /DNA_ORIENTATION=+
MASSITFAAAIPTAAARCSGAASKASRAVAFRPTPAVALTNPQVRGAARRSQRMAMTVRASDGGEPATAAPTAAAAAIAAAAAMPAAEPVPDGFEYICAFEDLPRGSRKEVNPVGKSILLFWYKDTVLCIESRSPAEGAFSEGFKKARLTQDGCIVCPLTFTTFALSTGEIRSWYPENPVMRRLTPMETCRPMEVFPVLVRADGIYVDVTNGSLGSDFRAATTKGGSDTSLENNNVYAVEPRMYIEGQEGMELDNISSSQAKMDPGTVAITIAGVGALALGGTATLVYYQNFVFLGLFWAVGFAIAAKVSLDATGALSDDE